jgi:hypothetical protein
MTAGTARAKVTPDLCLVDSHSAEQDCRRIQVDFRVELQVGTVTFPMRATEMCAAGITLEGDVRIDPGDKVQLRIAFPGRGDELQAAGVVTHINSGHINCEYWAANSYEQQFLNEFVQACARRQQLRKDGCAHQG